MRFESKFWRNWWIKIPVALVPDVLIGAALGYASSSFVIVVAIVIGLQLLYLAIWIKGAIWSWLVFRISGERQKMRLQLVDYLKENRFPEPDNYLRDPDEYFQNIKDNRNLPCELRIKAATELTAAQTWAQIGQKLRLVMAWEDAIEEYKRMFVREQNEGKPG